MGVTTRAEENIVLSLLLQCLRFFSIFDSKVWQKEKEKRRSEASNEEFCTGPEGPNNNNYYFNEERRNEAAERIRSVG